MPIIQLSNNYKDLVQIDPETGASLVKLVIKGRDILKYPLKTEDPQKGYPSALLFPFPNRIRDGRYTFESKSYELAINDIQGNNAIHGLLAFNNFNIIEKTPTSALLQYDYKGQNTGYPFPYTFSVYYKLGKNKLDIKVEVKNNGNSNMPFGFGWHPYFGFEGNGIKDLELKLPLRYNLELDERLLPTGEKQLEKFQVIPLKNTFIDNIFEVSKRGGMQEILLRDKNNVISIYQKTGTKGLNYFVIYTPPSRNCVAIEPQSCPTNAFNSEIDLEVLKPMKVWKCNFGVKLD